MKVKELIERLQSLDQNLDVYVYNEKESSLYSVETAHETSDFGWAEGWEDFVTIFPTTKSQSLFPLTAEEVEQLEMDILPDIIEEYKTHGRWSMEKLEFCKNLLNRIKQQDENNI